jgi:hypothetical protein
MRVVLLTFLATAFAGAGGSVVHARTADPPDLWATINVCDTAAHPNTIGIRGSMPGRGKKVVLWMRFQVQYLSASDGKWHNIVANADSKWRNLKSAKSSQAVDSGQDFEFLPPPNGGSMTLRGAVSFKWVKHGHILRKLRRITTAGHRSSKGADPPGYSAATCVIS